jgi:AhpD family alkylhydroperoxidase
MTARFDLRAASPGGFAAMMKLNAHVNASGLDAALLELVKIRVSQLNGCAFCIELHVAAARRLGVDEQRMHLVAAWREAPGLGAAERAALDWAEALTRLPDEDALGAAFARARAIYSVEQIAELSLAVAEINAWNRLMRAARTPPMSAGRATA